MAQRLQEPFIKQHIDTNIDIDIDLDLDTDIDMDIDIRRSQGMPLKSYRAPYHKLRYIPKLRPLRSSRQGKETETSTLGRDSIHCSIVRHNV